MVPRYNLANRCSGLSSVFSKVLIANRGEIALRIIRACKELGVATVAIYSEADVDSLHVQLADEAVCIGRPQSSESYLKIDRIISAAEITDVDAIHPGYGFLAENAHFAEVCASCNIKFIGPSPAAIRTMGDKNAAREQARKAGVPICPGSDGIIDSEKTALRTAKKIGYPVMLKAVAGGGGRGMRPAHNDGSLIQAFHAARTEAEKAFGNGDVYIEKLIEYPHHIEFQVIGDSHGRLVHLGERDCSIQRRNQKIVEECPSQLLDADLRKRMGKCSVDLARIQVEHPVTEEAYGCDLVREQIRIAAGEHLSRHVAEAVPRSHAIECRINAEDPDNNFQPSPGTIDLYYAPGGRGVRIDSHIYSKYAIPPYYDSLIAKLICVGSTRYSTVRRMARALSEYLITGIKTTIPFHVKIMQDAAFLRGEFDTGFVERLVGMKHLDIPK